MFVWNDFRKNGKWRREKWRENDVFGCLVEGGKDERFWWDPPVLSLPLQNIISPNWRENGSESWTKLPTFSFYYYYFLFLATSTWCNKCGLPTIFFVLFFFWVSQFHWMLIFLLLFFLFFKYDDVHQRMNLWFTIVSYSAFFF